MTILSTLQTVFGQNAKIARGARRAGDAARDARQWIEAAACYRIYLKSNGRDGPIWVQLGHALKEGGLTNEAESAYRRAIELNPNDADASLHLGHLLKVIGRLDEARIAYRTSASIRPGGDAAVELGALGTQVQGGSGQYTFGGQALEQGDAARAGREWNDAALHYSAHLAANPTDAAIWIQLGHAYKESLAYDKAEAAYRMAAILTPDDPDVFLQLGHLLKISERLAESRVAYKKSVALDPTGPAAFELVSSLMMGPTTDPADGQLDSADTFPSTSAQEGADDAARFGLLSAGDAARDRRHWNNAIRSYRSYLRIKPRDWRIWLQLGEALQCSGRVEEAAAPLQRAYDLAPDQSATQLALAKSLASIGRQEEAHAVLMACASTALSASAGHRLSAFAYCAV